VLEDQHHKNDQLHTPHTLLATLREQHAGLRSQQQEFSSDFFHRLSTWIWHYSNFCTRILTIEGTRHDVIKKDCKTGDLRVRLIRHRYIIICELVEITRNFLSTQ
jgi:hypothetical protein